LEQVLLFTSPTTAAGLDSLPPFLLSFISIPLVGRAFPFHIPSNEK